MRLKHLFSVFLTLLTLAVEQMWGETAYSQFFTIQSADVVSGTSYQPHSATVNTRGWIITFGGNNNSVGTNSSKRSSCTLSSYSKYAVSPVTSSQTASAFVSTTSIADISKISYTYTSNNKGSNSTNVYLIYSSNGTSFSQMELTSGTQGATISSGTAFEFAKCSGYFGLLFVATNSSSDWRIDAVNITFYQAEEEPTETYTVTYNPEGGSCTTSSEEESSPGAGVILPAATTTCTADGWAFYGWTTDACAEETGTAPAIVGKAGDSYHPTSDITLHAVFAKGEYTKITSTSDLNATSKYFFAAKYSNKNYVMTSSYNDGKLAAMQIDESSDNIYNAALIDPKWCYTLESSGTKWFILDCNSNNSNHYLDTYYSEWYGHSKDSYDSYTFAYSSNYWNITNSYGDNKYFGYSNSDGAFKPFNSAQNLLIYKQTTAPSYYSNPSCCTSLGTINGSVSLYHFHQSLVR